VFVVGCSQDTTHTVQSAWCSRTPGWLLPQPCRLVFAEYTQCWSRLMRLFVERLHQSGEWL